MTHKEKINYMRMSASMAGIGFFSTQNLDMLVSMYDLLSKNKGSLTLKDIMQAQKEVKSRYDVPEMPEPPPSVPHLPESPPDDLEYKQERGLMRRLSIKFIIFLLVFCEFFIGILHLIIHLFSTKDIPLMIYWVIPLAVLFIICLAHFVIQPVLEWFLRLGEY